MSKSADPRIQFIEDLAYASLRVEIKDKPLIFLCGGPMNDLSIPTAGSTRDSLMRYVSDKKARFLDYLSLAESFYDWQDAGTYKDLHEFENDIGAIASLIVVILESAGSLVEFGMFTEHKILRNKLLIIIDESHYEVESFITLGPIRTIEGISENRVSSRVIISGVGDTELEAILVDIKSEVDALHKSVAFDQHDDGHIAFLMVSLVELFRALEAKEILNYLSLLHRDTSFELKRVKQLLFLLERFELISKKKKGRKTYYLKGKRPSNIEIIKSGDHGEFLIELAAYYKKDSGSTERRKVIDTRV